VEDMSLVSLHKNDVNLFEETEREEKKRLRSFFPSCFVVCPLPMRSTKEDVKEYIKSYNNYDLRIIGTKGIPGGKMARDMLMLFTTEAVCRGEEKKGLKLSYNSIKEFENSMGRNVTAKYDYVLNILEQYSGCMMNFEARKKISFEKKTYPLFAEEMRDEIGSGKISELRYRGIINVPFIEKMEDIRIMRDQVKNGESIKLVIEVARQFVEVAKRNSIPVDFSVYREMNSPLMKDLYVWFVYRNNGILPEGGVFISKKNLIEQFGDGNENNEGVKYHRIIEAVREIKKRYYENLNVEIYDKGSSKNKGIKLERSPVIMKENDIRYVPLISI
jgi:hypothetical protein